MTNKLENIEEFKIDIKAKRDEELLAVFTDGDKPKKEREEALEELKRRNVNVEKIRN